MLSHYAGPASIKGSVMRKLRVRDVGFVPRNDRFVRFNN